MPRKIRLAFQLAPLNSSPVATRIVYMRITFFYTHVTSLYPDAGAAYETRSKFRLGARDHEREAQREKERKREAYESGKFLHARSISSRNLYASFVGSDRCW